MSFVHCSDKLRLKFNKSRGPSYATFGFNDLTITLLETLSDVWDSKKKRKSDCIKSYVGKNRRGSFSRICNAEECLNA